MRWLKTLASVALPTLLLAGVAFAGKVSAPTRCR